MSADLARHLDELATTLAGLASQARTARDDRPLDTASSDDPVAIAEALVARFGECVDEGDLDGLDELVHHDIVYVVPGRSRIAGVYEGRDGLRHAMTVLPRRGVHQLRAKVTDVMARADRVVAFHELAGTVDGEPCAFEFVLRFTIRDGLIAEITEFSGDQHSTDGIFG